MMEYEMAAKLTQEMAMIRCDKYHPYNGHAKLNFTGTRELITVFCFEPDHGEFKIIFSNYASPSRSSGCPKCGGKEKLTPEIAKIRCDKYHPYNGHAKLNFTGTRELITVFCFEPDHGEFKTTFFSYASPSSNSGCPKCHGGIAFTQEQYLTMCIKAHPEYDHSKMIFKGSREKIIIICRKSGHGEFLMIARNYVTKNKSRSGCPSCAESGFKPNSPAVLYFFKIDGLWKVGVTNNSVNQRYSGCDKDRMTEIREIPYSTGQEALDEETRIKKTYAPYRTKRTDQILRQTKNTELFEIDLYREIYGTENRKQVG